MSLAYKISAFNRQRKWKTFLGLFPLQPQNTILDLGFTAKEYSNTDNYLEKNYPYPEKITALGIDDPKEFSERYPKIKALNYNGGIFPLDTQSFDIGWSNAVIEHVGNRKAQLIFIKEIKRVAKRGFITTPNRYFPIEVHTRVPLLHFLPKPLFYSFLKLIGKTWATGNYMNLLSLSDIKQLLKDADINDYRIIKNKFFGFTLDFIITW